MIRPPSIKPSQRRRGPPSLRDHMAASAMHGELSAMGKSLPLDIPAYKLEHLSKHWYRIADHMLKASKS